MIDENITGNASGNFILYKIWNSLLPIALLASIIFGSIVLIPPQVLLTIGNRAYILSAIIAVVFPIPVIEIKNPKRAIEGIVYATFTIEIT